MAAGSTTGTSVEPNLGELAGLYGVQTSYVDMANRHIDAEPESIILALRALGAPVQRMDHVPAALAARKAQLHLAPQPVIVAWDGRLTSDSSKLPSGMKGTLVLEDGSEARWPPKKDLPFGYHTLKTKGNGHAG